MLGLRRGTVRLVEHVPEWKHDFATHAKLILSATGLAADRVQHVGSTAVAGLVSKPIVDIVVGMDDMLDVDAVAASLESVGYADRGSGEGSTGRLLVAECEPEVRTVHIHIVQHDSQDWHDYVVFRDRLSREETLRSQYEGLKRELAFRFPNDRKAYTAAKRVFIQSALAGAGS